MLQCKKQLKNILIFFFFFWNKSLVNKLNFTRLHYFAGAFDLVKNDIISHVKHWMTLSN